MDLEPLVAAQQIVADYVETNATDIVLDAETVLVGEFNVCPGETLEFQLALSTLSGLNMAMDALGSENRVTSVQLLENSEVAASALIDTSVRDSQHRLFYKLKNETPMVIEFDIQVTSVVTGTMTDTFAMI